MGLVDRSAPASNAILCAVAGALGGAVGAVVTWQWLDRRRMEARAAKGGVPVCRAAWLREAPGPRPRVILVVTGSVASVKVPELAVALYEFAELAVVLTSPGATMVEDVSGRYNSAAFAQWEALKAQGSLHVLSDDDEWQGYRDVAQDSVVHIELRKWADIVVVAPCSANTLSKIALGLCDNLATCLMRGWSPEKPVVLAPAMNTVMWEHPTNTSYLDRLQSWGYKIVPPASKLLACGDVGRGALASVPEVVEAVRAAVCGFEGRRAQDGPGGWQRKGFPEWRSAL